MAASDSLDVSGWLDEHLAAASPDLLRVMIKQFAEALMNAEVDAVCGAGYRERSDVRVNSRNGYRLRDWDTRAGNMELAIPKLRSGSYFPEWLLERRRRAEQALISVIATSYLLGASTRRVEKLVGQLGIAQLSKSQVNEMAKSLDGQVEAFRSRPLDDSAYTFLWLDALTQKVREAGRTVIGIGVGDDSCGLPGSVPGPCAHSRVVVGQHSGHRGQRLLGGADFRRAVATGDRARQRHLHQIALPGDDDRATHAVAANVAGALQFLVRARPFRRGCRGRRRPGEWSAIAAHRPGSLDRSEPRGRGAAGRRAPSDHRGRSRRPRRRSLGRSLGLRPRAVLQCGIKALTSTSDYIAWLAQ